MIYPALVSPTEFVTSSTDLKRALLTFDKVYIPDPNDREFFPPQAFGVAMGMPPIFGTNGGPVKPLGKMPGYNDEFQRILDEFRVAEREGLVEVVSSYDRSSSDMFTIGAVQMGGYPLHPQFLLWSYRNVARDEDVVASAIEGDSRLLSLPDELIQELAVRGAADGGINDDPSIAAIQRPLARETLREHYSSIGRGRVASVMKTIGFCVSKNLIPFFADRTTNNVAQSIVSRANRVLDAVSEVDPHWALRSQVLRLAHEEYIDEAVLARMSVGDVIKLRTHAWGMQAAARDELLRSAAEVAAEIGSATDFEERVKTSIHEYRKAAESLERERANFRFQVRCEVATAVGLSASGGGAEVAGILSQLQTGIGAATTLVAGCLYAIEKIKDYVPISQQLKAAEEESRDKAGFGLHNFYRNIEAAVRP